MKLSSFTQKITIRTVALLFVAVSMLFIVLGLYKTSDADASAVSGFQAGRIIDDSVFYNAGSMSASQIQTFLNSKVTCDTDGTAPATDWGRPDITHATLASYIRNGTNGYTKNTNFHAPPYTCLKNFKQNTPQVEAASGLCGGIPARTNRTAAQIILDVSNACGINPQVLLVLLEKEQSLVTDTWPLNHQYNRATGFACPDNVGGACDPKFNGFYSQVYAAARQFKVYKAYPTSYNYIAGRTNNILWQVVPDGSKEGIFFTNGSPSSRRNGHCGYSQVTIQNQATAALYIYTPYRPNSAALSSYPGTGDACSAYGNRNFYGMFSSWFGSPSFSINGGIRIKYDTLGGAATIGSPISSAIALSIGNGAYQEFERGRIYWKEKIGSWLLRGAIKTKYLQERGHSGKLGYPKGDSKPTGVGGVYQEFEQGRIYWSTETSAHMVRGGISTKYISLGGPTSPAGLPTNDAVALPDGGAYQEFENGRIYWKSGTGAWYMRGAILTKYLTDSTARAKLGYPKGDSKPTGVGGVYQEFEQGRIYWSTETSAHMVRGGISTKYISLGGPTSPAGLPTNDAVALPDGGAYQEFENGRIYWKSGTGAWYMRGAILTKYLTDSTARAKLGYPKGDVIEDSSTKQHQIFEHGTITLDNSKVTILYN